MRWTLPLLVLLGCVPTGEEDLPESPPVPRQEEAVGLILDAYELGRPRMAIDWVRWSDCLPPEFRQGAACVRRATEPGPVFRLRPPVEDRFSFTPLAQMICEHFLRACPLSVTDKALNALLHAGL